MSLTRNFVTAVLLFIALIFGVMAYVVSPGTEPVIFEMPKDATALANWKAHSAWSLAFEVGALAMVVMVVLLKLRRNRAASCDAPN